MTGAVEVLRGGPVAVRNVPSENVTAAAGLWVKSKSANPAQRREFRGNQHSILRGSAAVALTTNSGEARAYSET